MPRLYAVNEIFYSLQGEGYFTGTPAVFLRFSGCNRRCSFCDTDHTAATPMSASQIVSTLKQYPARHVVCTGGEPLLQLDEALIKLLKDNGFYVQIETNGTLPVPAGIDWVTCSPKDPPLHIDSVDELKVVFQDQDVEALAELFPDALLFLQPLSGQNTDSVVRYILSHPHWRLSLQTHKLINIP